MTITRHGNSWRIGNTYYRTRDEARAALRVMKAGNAPTNVDKRAYRTFVFNLEVAESPLSPNYRCTFEITAHDADEAIDLLHRAAYQLPYVVAADIFDLRAEDAVLVG
jgi:hypothetical protein